jgi:hypothetical protein
VARRGEGALTDVVFGHEETSSGGLVGVLRAVGEKRLQALLDVWRDIHDEGRADVSIERGIENLVRAVLGASDVELRQSTCEAGFVAERGGGVVVGVATLPIGKDDDPGPQATQNGGDLEAVGLRIFDVAIGEIERLAVRVGAASASARRSSAVPRVPDSPWVRSRMPVRQPRACIASRVPPQVCSTSSRCAAMARMSSIRRCQLQVVSRDVTLVRGVGECIHEGDVERSALHCE